MEYELKALEQIVSVIERPSNLKPGKQDTAFLGKHKRLAHIEKERIKFKFIQASFEPGSEDRIEMYFRQHQLVLVQLTDIFYRASKGNVHDKLSKELIDCVDFPNPASSEQVVGQITQGCPLLHSGTQTD